MKRVEIEISFRNTPPCIPLPIPYTYTLYLNAAVAVDYKPVMEYSSLQHLQPSPVKPNSLPAYVYGERTIKSILS